MPAFPAAIQLHKAGGHVKVAEIENQLDSIFSCTQGYEECASGHSYGPAVRKSCMIHYITQGKVVFRVDGKEYSLSKGDLFFIEPGKEVYYKAGDKDPWGYGWVGMTGIHIESCLFRTSLFDCPAASYSKDYSLSLIFIEMQRACSQPLEIRDLALNHVLYKLLAFWLPIFRL